MRLDRYLVEQGYCTSRTDAQRCIMAGEVRMDGVAVIKPSAAVKGTPDIIMRSAKPYPYVSRGGVKLAAALEHFSIIPHGWHVLDVGVSTGGFTDCLLQNGTASITAVDVGYGQLDWKLRNDERVIVLERTNARYLQPEAITTSVDFIVMDVSFISVCKVIANLIRFIKPSHGWLVLIKPQFEAGRHEVGKGGVVRDKAVHQAVLRRIASWLNEQQLPVTGVYYSPIKGPKGNIEFWFRMGSDGAVVTQEAFDRIVEEAHNCLDG